MRVQLTFTNDSGSEIADQRTVYLAIDEEKGENHMRRSLPRRFDVSGNAASAGIFSRSVYRLDLDSFDRSAIEVRSDA